MEEKKYLELLAALFLNKIVIPNTSTKMEIAPLWLMSLVKLESMCPSFTEFAEFMHHFLPSFLSLSRIAMFILLKQREYERNLKSSSIRVSPPLASDFDVSKISKFSSTEVKLDEAKSSLKNLNSCLSFYDERIHCPSEVKNYFYEKFSNSFFYSRKEFDMLGFEFGVGNVLSLLRNWVSHIALSLGGIASIANIQNNCASEESNYSNLSLKQEGNEHESEIIESIELGNCELSRRAWNMHLSSHLELEKGEVPDALCLPLKETNDFIFDFKYSDVSSKCISSNSDVGKENFSEEHFPLREETNCESCDNTSSKCNSFYSHVQKENFSEEADFPLIDEINPHGSSITASNLCSNGKMLRVYTSSHSDVHKGDYSEKANSPLKEETDAQKSTLINDFYSSTEIPNKFILSNFGRQFVISGESFKIINLIEFAHHLRESEYSKENTTFSLENSEEVGFYFFDQAAFENAKLLQNQFLCAKKYAAMNNLVQEEAFSENKDSNVQKHSEDYCQTSIFGEAKNLLKYEFLEYLQETVEEILPTEERTCSQLQEELEFQEEHIEETRVEKENQEGYSKVKMDYSTVETSKYYDIDNDLVQKILFSVYDFICEIEGNAFFCVEKQNLISELQLECKDIHSEPDCVKSIRILLYFLDNIKMDLETKKDEASKLKLNLKDVRELYSYDLKNSKEGRELQETAKKFVAESDKVYAGIEKDIADCEWYYRNLEKILHFYQNKCFIISDCESCDDVSSKCISNLDVNKETFPEEADFPLKVETDGHGNSKTASDFCSSGEMPSERILSNSDVRKDNYSEDAYSHLKEEIEPHGSTITESDFCLRGDMSSECTSSRSDVHKDQYSEEADSLLKEETDPQKSTLTTDIYSSTEIPNNCILSKFGRHFVISGESFKIINLIEFAHHLRENEYSKEKKCSSFENYEVGFYFFNQADFENAKFLQNQFHCAKKYATDSNVAHEEELPESKDSKTQNDYSEGYYQTSIFDEAKNLLKCNFLEYLLETVEEISPAEEGTCSQLQEEIEFREKHIEEIHFKEVNLEKDSAEKKRKCNALDNDLLQKILFSVYDFICEIEGNASMEKQNLISEPQFESEEIHSEPDCVKSVRILLYFLNNIKVDLESKKDEASQLKLNSEDVRVLYSYDFKNTKEARELQETAKKFVAEYDKVYADIEKDIADCEWYYKNLENILDFYHNKCFISSPDL